MTKQIQYIVVFIAYVARVIQSVSGWWHFFFDAVPAEGILDWLSQPRKTQWRTQDFWLHYDLLRTLCTCMWQLNAGSL